MRLSLSIGATCATITALALAGCSSSTDQASSAPAGSVFGHVHGIALNPGDERVYVASHNGVFRLDDRTATLIADRAQDTMGFTIAGPDQFLASGHPAPGSTDPNPLGLIGSSDRAATWSPLSLEGTSDFHSIDTAGNTIYAYGSDGQIMSSGDGGQTWSILLRGQFIDIAADPTDPENLLITTQTGELIAVRPGEEPAAVVAAPPMVLVDRTPEGEVVGVDPNGSVVTSRDGGSTWQQAGSLDSRPEALSVRSDTWFAATEKGLFTSTDDGATWQPLPVESA